MNESLRYFRRRTAPAAPGFSVVELMVALVLGLIVVGSALAIFLSNRQTYTATESLGRTQENARLAFELMAHEIREVGSTPCGNARRAVGNVLNAAGSQLYNWQGAVTGYDGGVPIPGIAFGTAPGNRIAGTDAIELRAATTGGIKVASHDAAGGTFTMLTADHGFGASDVVVACDYIRGTVFQISSVSGDEITYTAGTTPAPGNSTIALGSCLEVGCPPGIYTFQPNAVVTRLGASRWYIGANDAGGNSLYQETLRNVGGVSQANSEEIARGVNNLQASYLLNTNPAYYQNRLVTPAADYVASVPANDWSRVLAVRLELRLAGPEQVGGSDVTRDLTYTITLRNQNI